MAHKIFKPCSLAILIACMVDLPVVTTSSIIITESPDVIFPSIYSCRPCALGSLRMEKASIGLSFKKEVKETATAIGSAPIVSPPIALGLKSSF